MSSAVGTFCSVIEAFLSGARAPSCSAGAFCSAAAAFGSIAGAPGSALGAVCFAAVAFRGVAEAMRSAVATMKIAAAGIVVASALCSIGIPGGMDDHAALADRHRRDLCRRCKL